MNWSPVGNYTVNGVEYRNYQCPNCYHIAEYVPCLPPDRCESCNMLLTLPANKVSEIEENMRDKYRADRDPDIPETPVIASTSINTGSHLDEGKVRLDLIPSEAIFALGDILTYGCKKYAPRNWEGGIAYSKIWGSILRHGYKWIRGEQIDPESGFPHLEHMMCNLMFLVTYERRGLGVSLNDITKKEIK